MQTSGQYFVCYINHLIYDPSLIMGFSINEKMKLRSLNFAGEGFKLNMVLFLYCMIVIEVNFGGTKLLKTF